MLTNNGVKQGDVNFFIHFKYTCYEPPLVAFSQEVAEPVPSTVFAFLPVPATVAGGIERVAGKLTLTDGMDPVQGGNHLPPVPWLYNMKSRHSVGDIFHVPTGNLVPGHLFKTECDAGNPEPI